MSATEKLGSKVPLPTAPLGPLSSVGIHFTWREREGEGGGRVGGKKEGEGWEGEGRGRVGERGRGKGGREKGGGGGVERERR